MAIGDFSKSRKLLARKRLQKRISARRVLLETLESRQLLAVGPQLLGIQPNTGDLLENGEILNESPRELVFRFDDAAGIDPETLDGIRIIRSGEDGVFERASRATDLGTNGQTLVGFFAQEPGEPGNGIEISFSRVNRTNSRAPIVRVDGRSIDVELNSNPSMLTRVEDLLQAFSPSIQTPATQLVYALRLRGSQTIGIGNTVDVNRDLVLTGANAAKASTDFDIGNNVEVRFVARSSGNAGLGLNVNVTARDRGGAGNPIVWVSGDTINVELNSNQRFPTTIREFVDAINSNSQASQLIEAQLVSGEPSIRLGTLPTTYLPIELSGVTDIEVEPAYVGLGDTDREVILRFAEAMPDDRYRIEILGQGVRTLRNVDGGAFNEGVSQAVAFELDLGARIESVIPQPVTRNSSGNLEHHRNRIDVYFNDDDLIDASTIVSVNGIGISQLRELRQPFFLQNTDSIQFASGASGERGALDPNFYQLFHTGDTLDNSDDVRVLPAAVRYYPHADRVSLTFNRNLDELVDPATGNPLPDAEFRLRIGTNESRPLAPVDYDGLTDDPADTFEAADDLNSVWTPGDGGSQSILIDSEIRNTTPFLLDFPGGSDEPGNRNNRHQDNLRLEADSVDGISTIFYNFQSNLGRFSNSDLVNAITEQQRSRVREVMSIYERYLGVRFVESEARGFTIGVGDMRAIIPFEEIAGSGNPGVIELNAPGGTFYEAGTLRVNGQPGTVLDIQDFGDSTRNEFGGTFQRAAMQAVGRLLGLGLADEVEPLTIQAFDAVFAPGVGTEIVLPGDADIVHGQFVYRPDSKDIDLYQFSLPIAGRMSIETFAERMSDVSLLDSHIRLYQQSADGEWIEIAANGDYYSSDSFMELDLAQGNYIVGVSASGNDSYDPTIEDSGIGGKSQGRYQLRMDFQPPAERVLRDATGTPIDGNLDGTPGGVHHFWFRASGPNNTQFVDKSAASGGNGSAATPYRHIKDALSASSPGDVVRIVGNGGADGQLSTVEDNLAYEIGFDSLGRPLPDGSQFNVPRDVSVMIDAGAILKMRRARVGVGSTSVNVDRSGGSLLVLGTPKLLTSDGAVVTDAVGNPVAGSVFFTSANDGQLGINANPAVVGSTPSPGDWGGLDFRNRVDAGSANRTNQEEFGLFLNSVMHADLRYGGGQVVVDGVSRTITPVQMVDMRPSVVFSTIGASADAAMNATPNSFLETNFHSPAEQAGASFTVDYDRVGPQIRGNRLVDNSINGLQVRIRTASGTQLETMTVPGRFDDTDIVHYIPENLRIEGTPGGARLVNESPASTLTTLTVQTTGNLPNGIYNYRFTRIDSAGQESAPSEPTESAFVFGNSGQIRLNSLPVGINRIYRSGPDGQGPYELAAEFESSPSSFTDSGGSLGEVLSDDLAVYEARLDSRLAIDPGTVVKSRGARINVDMGGQLIAEGLDGSPVVFTSLNDQRYGAGGTFDTANRGESQEAAAGDWGGIYVGHTSKASLDHAVVAFGGGTTRVEGGFADFNSIEVHQGDLRLANSLIESAEDGGNAAGDTRSGRGTNSPAAVFIRGAQPTIVSNVFIGNQGPVISANVSSLNSLQIDDPGRSTGSIDQFTEVVGNRGPLVADNRLSDNEYNGMHVRGGFLTTEGWWDDTDIVHIVFDEIQVPDFQHFGGLRLSSSPEQSLVVKLDGDEAGFTATGNRLDNADRIGGSVQILGQSNHPVILTSLNDSSVGAGFTLLGEVQTDTRRDLNGDPDAAAAGDWRGVLFDTNSNDRNVAVVNENESSASTSTGTNDHPDSAQALGAIAPNLKSGDENRRLGFQINGQLANPTDVDVYSFFGDAGTEVWLDIDRTDNSLDTVVELVDADGRTLAMSTNSLQEEADSSLLYRSPELAEQTVNPLRKSSPEFFFSSATGAPKDLYSTNPKDAGMRVVLPGQSGSNNLYHVRVRSSSLQSGDSVSDLLTSESLQNGRTKGAYQLQIRLSEVDEIPGSSINYADIRFATNGIELRGVPGNSPLLGENAEVELRDINGDGQLQSNDTFANAQFLGNLLETNRQALSVAGELDNLTDVDWFSFDIDYQRITPTALREYFATVIDMDYADGIGRPDTSLYVFDADGNLMLSSLGGELVDDQASPVGGAGNSDLSRGSAGRLDPYMGSFEMPVGTYFMAVTNSQMVPEIMNTFTDPDSPHALVRLEPIESIARIAEDRVGGFSGTPVLFDSAESPVDFNLSDLAMYVTQTVGQQETNVYIVNPFTGEVRNQVGRGGFDVQDIAYRPNGELRAFDRTIFPLGGDDDRDARLQYINIDPGTADFTATEAPIDTFHLEFDDDGAPTVVGSDDGMNPEAITFAVIGGQERGFMVANRPTPPGEVPPYFPGTRPIDNVGTARPGVNYFTNVIYEFDENTGQATSAPANDKEDIPVGTGAGTAIRERGYIETFTLDAAGQPITQASELGTVEATSGRSATGPNLSIQDGDTFTVVDSLGFQTTFEFNFGPEVVVNYDPSSGDSVADGMQFQLDGVVYEFDVEGGTPGVSAGATAIPLAANASLRQFIDAIALNVNNNVTASFDSGRMNFSGATSGDFTDLVNAGMFVDLGSTGGVAGGNVGIDLLANDTAETVAARIVREVQEIGIPGLSASADGNRVVFSSGISVVNSGPLLPAGIGPGGIVTGIAVFGNQMYAVSDEGGLYVVNNPTALRTGNVGQYVDSSFELTGIEFTGLVAGPTHASGGELSQLLFGIDASGSIHAFDTNGELQPVFANGSSSVDTGLPNLNGLALSTLDFNLWHRSNQRSGDAGHGIVETPNDSRNNVNGGNSFYFGFEGPGPNGVPSLSGPNATGLEDSYNFPGGAAGALESRTFSLSGLSEGDLPTLYFNYRFDTEDASSDLPLGNNADDYMRDSLRVYVSGEDGQWVLLATNNDPAQGGSNNGFFDDELDGPLTGNPSVQRLFDNTGQFRQARVPLTQFAGQDNLKLRIEFSSHGGFGYGLPGGKGPEIRTISGERLADGQELVIEGQRFEIEMGPTLTLPGGSAISNGDALTIEGVQYVFTDGDLAVADPDLAVPFDSSMTASEVASSLLNVLLATAPVKSTIDGLAFDDESNDTLPAAERAPVNGDSMVVTGSGEIGDNPGLSNAGEDVDMVRIDLDRGAQVTVDVRAAVFGSSLDSFLRTFDAEGRPLRDGAGQVIENNNRPGSTDSRVTFVAPEDGTYFIGVSGAGNQNYNPTVEGTASDGSSGQYELVIDVTRRLVPVLSGNRLQLDGVKEIDLPNDSPITLQGALGAVGVPVFTSLHMDRTEVAAALREAIAGHFAGGTTDVYKIRGGDTLELGGISSFGLDSGPFGLTANFVGDQFSAFNTSTNFDGSTNNSNPGALGAQDNAHEGVYLDDFIIGIAGRGEMVLGANQGNTNFIEDPQLAVTNPERVNPEILVGPYQFEIRGGEEYGVPLLDGFPVTLDQVREFAPDERFASGLSIRFNGAASFSAGSTFTVSDGTTVLTFEMDAVGDGVGVQPGHIALPFNPAAVDSESRGVKPETSEVIAARFRDIINSSEVRARLNLTANLLNNDGSGATSSEVVLFGRPSVEIPTSIGQRIVSENSGARNRERPQGQVVIDSARISNSLNYGAVVETGGRDPQTDAPLIGAPRNTVTINDQRLTPGATIRNSEFMFNNQGGVQINGTPQQTGMPNAPVPFVKFVNNTIVGGTVVVPEQPAPTVENGISFPASDFSFADQVVDYSPLFGGGPAPAAGLDDPTAALGPPDYTGNGEPQPDEGVVSLGRGGQLTLEFTTNLLTGSDDANPDLVIFEVGDSEEVLVEVSVDGTEYTSVGVASANSPTIDIDAFGFNQSSRLSFVRLTDVSGQGSQDGDSVGADIDAVGAISTVLAEIFTPGGEGVTVTNNATATLLNNVLINNEVGINVDASSNSTVIGGTIFQRNSTNTAGAATNGQFADVLSDQIPVYVSIAQGNLYPTSGSPVIDSSIDSLEDRPALVSVRQPLGIPASPILAPQFDINGQLRVDDPTVDSPSGLGENVFKDRGAQDRADFVGPSVVLRNPADNDLAGEDRNPAESIVELTGVTPRYFDIRLIDGLEPSDPSSGSGIDHSTVTSSSVLVYRNGQPLVEGLDYRFGYDSTNGVVRLQPLAGIWASENVYEIRFLNSRESVVVARSAMEYTDGQQFQVIDAANSNTTFEFDLGYLVRVPSENGVDADLEGGTTFILDDGMQRMTFEMDTTGTVLSGNQRVNLGSFPTPQSAGRAIQTAIQATGLAVNVMEIEDGLLQIQGGRLTSLLSDASGLEVEGQPGVQTEFGIQIPLETGVPADLNDGQTFTIDRSGEPVTFELDTNNSTLPDNLPVRFSPGANASQIGAALVDAIEGAALGLSPSYDGDGLVRLGGDSNTRLDMSQTGLSQTGEAGRSASVAIDLPADATATEVATLITQTIDGQNLGGVTTTQFGTRVVIEGANGVGGTGTASIRAIRDLAGNPLKPNREAGSTTLTVVLGEGLDYGDAPAPFASLRADDGPRHTVVPGLSFGPTVTVDADAKLPDADQDDGLTLRSQLVAAFQATIDIEVTNNTGEDVHMSLWIDFNQDGFFSSTERLVNAQRVTQDVTTLSFLVPSSAALGDTFLRMRLSTDPDAISQPTGFAPDGEVEDHQLTILTNPYNNPENNLDVNGDGFVSPIDALQVINWLNDPDRPTILRLADATGQPPFVDVNGDGTVTAVDALQVVNHLNNRTLLDNGGGEGEGFSESERRFAADRGDHPALGGSETVLASDWAPGLETWPRRSEGFLPEARRLSPTDVALLSEDEDDERWIDAVSSRSNANLMAQYWSGLEARAFTEPEVGEEPVEVGLHDELIEDLFG